MNAARSQEGVNETLMEIADTKFQRTVKDLFDGLGLNRVYLLLGGAGEPAPATPDTLYLRKLGRGAADAATFGSQKRLRVTPKLSVIIPAGFSGPGLTRERRLQIAFSRLARYTSPASRRVSSFMNRREPALLSFRRVPTGYR